MKTNTTSERLKQIMELRNLRQADILAAAAPFCKVHNVTLGKSMLSQYIAGKNEPGQQKIMILSLALQVNPLWLMGFDAPMDAEGYSAWDGHHLRKIRMQVGETPEQVAHVVGIPVDDYRLYEQGKANPPVSVLHRLADHFKCSIDYILEFSYGDYSGLSLATSDSLTAREVALVSNYRKADPEYQRIIDNIVLHYALAAPLKTVQAAAFGKGSLPTSPTTTEDLSGMEEVTPDELQGT